MILLIINSCNQSPYPSIKNQISTEENTNNDTHFKIDKDQMRDSLITIGNESLKTKIVYLHNFDTIDYFLCLGKFNILNVEFFECIDSTGRPSVNMRDFYSCSFKMIPAGKGIDIILDNKREYKMLKPTIKLYSDTVKSTCVFFKDSLTF